MRPIDTLNRVPDTAVDEIAGPAVSERDEVDGRIFIASRLVWRANSQCFAPAIAAIEVTSHV